ncbi:hypothetical protein SCHAM137S_05271 [Streptomyces chartreusis]
MVYRHPVPGAARTLMHAIVLAVHAGDDRTARMLLTRLASVADTTWGAMAESTAQIPRNAGYETFPGG